MSDYNLKQEIKKLGMTQKGFAEEFGLHEDTVSKWARGLREVPQWAKKLIYLKHIEIKYNDIKKLLSDDF